MRKMSPLKNLSSILLFICLTVLPGCFTPQKEKELNNDIFNLQTRVLQLETSTKKRAADKSTQKHVASVTSDMERITIDIQKIKGEIGALKIGVVTGQMPGTDPNQEGSVAQTLNNIITRLEALELAQSEIMSTIEDIGKNKKKSKKKSRTKISSISALQKAFDKKRYKHVAQDAPRLIRKSKKKDKSKILFVYAESLYKLGKLRDAALQFNDFIDNQPRSSKIPHAKMRMGDCFRHLGDKATARLYYQDLVDNYPKASEAEKAKERLSKMK